MPQLQTNPASSSIDHQLPEYPTLPNEPSLTRYPLGRAVKPLLLLLAWSLPTLPAVVSVNQPDVAAMDLAMSLLLPP
jgi:hypothetical protein